jgi:hypothetical protein
MEIVPILMILPITARGGFRLARGLWRALHRPPLVLQP